MTLARRGVMVCERLQGFSCYKLPRLGSVLLAMIQLGLQPPEDHRTHMNLEEVQR